jgi:hypothetical protein
LSLRHTYATFRLQEGVNHYVLARNMGTSVKMLENFYGHTSDRAMADELTKMKVKKPKVLPWEWGALLVMTPTMRVPDWIWKSFVAGLCGMTAHSLLMFFKARMGLLPSFQPYEALQAMLRDWVGGAVPSILPWMLSFLSGSTVIGLLFGSIYQKLPGHSGATKGILIGVLGWLRFGIFHGRLTSRRDKTAAEKPTWIFDKGVGNVSSPKDEYHRA